MQRLIPIVEIVETVLKPENLKRKLQTILTYHMLLQEK
jgi:hypothetical protein